MKEFSNQQIDTSGLPSMDEVSFLSLSSSYRKVVLINASVVSLFIIALSSVFYWWDFEIEQNASMLYIAAISLVLGIFLAVFFWVISILGFSKKGYAFREHDVIYKSGFIVTREIVIPYNRVQHVALHEGILSRVYQLATLEFFTAGSANGDLKIPGIPKQQAEKIKQFITQRITTSTGGNTQDVEVQSQHISEDYEDISTVNGEL